MVVVHTWIDRLEDLQPLDGADPERGVVLMRYPLALGERQTALGQQLLAELLELQGEGSLTGAQMRPPRRLLELADRIIGEYGPALERAAQRRAEASAQGLTHVDLSYPASTATREVILTYARLMEQVDVYSRAGTLRTPAPDVRLYALRRWTSEEFVRQHAGYEPRPWDGPAD